jgi:Histidine kinase-, DNA gyrase B-, and HSP90-like ATPase
VSLALAVLAGIALTGGAFWLLALNGTLRRDPFVGLTIATVATYTAMGALLWIRVPSNRIGPLFLGIGLGLLSGGFTSEYATYGFATNPGAVPHPIVAAWFIIHRSWPTKAFATRSTSRRRGPRSRSRSTRTVVGRYSRDLEATVYFCALEALNNIAKYAEAKAASVALTQTDGALTFTVTDDGRGFDQDAVTYGTGLQGMRTGSRRSADRSPSARHPAVERRSPRRSR